MTEENVILKLLEPSFRFDYTFIMKYLTSTLENEIKHLEASVMEVKIDTDGYPLVTLSGEDRHVASNFISRIHGSYRPSRDFIVGDIVVGRIANPKNVGFGIFANIGCTKPDQEALLPLFAVRNQLTPNVSPAPSVRKIIGQFGFVEDRKMEFKITSIENEPKLKINLELSESELSLYTKWKKEKRQKVIVVGTMKKTLVRVLKEAGNMNDVEEIETIGLFEYAVTLKRGTRASGIIPRVGKMLPYTRLGKYAPKK
ncbi:MAG: DUF2110 family protein [Candidatus Heimdallarchaeota archaeon]|nr:DUF2110 family protein [Candidatus Heimdallarchaeota archaeon]MCK5048312.1 DUF2110 family protein [Candidatus Heimdallarchaeota archaeon]